MYVISLYMCCYFFVFINVYVKKNMADMQHYEIAICHFSFFNFTSH